VQTAAAVEVTGIVNDDDDDVDEDDIEETDDDEEGYHDDVLSTTRLLAETRRERARSRSVFSLPTSLRSYLLLVCFFELICSTVQNVVLRF